MRVARTTAEVRAFYRNERPRGTTVAFVPTMGALHAGHLSLVTRASEAADLVVVSIFVNPLQFGPSEDFDAYPRDETRDVASCEEAGVNLVFIPSMEHMYPDGAATSVVVEGPLATTFEGASRPGHFDGVATIVSKLFNVVDPEVAVFGQKDAQQVAVIRRMVRDLCYRTEIVVGATVRETDGLALSSRNAYLSEADREAATSLYRALTLGEEACRAGGPAAAVAVIETELDGAAGVERDYAAAVDPYSFGAPADGGPVLLAVAARVGRTRLIDNVLVQP